VEFFARLNHLRKTEESLHRGCRSLARSLGHTEWQELRAITGMSNYVPP
jgi:hypothetical protein